MCTIYVVNDNEDVVPDFSEPISTGGRSLSEIFSLIKSAAGVDSSAIAEEAEDIHLCFVMQD
jgi:hypothetical protein